MSTVEEGKKGGRKVKDITEEDWKTVLTDM